MNAQRMFVVPLLHEIEYFYPVVVPRRTLFKYICGGKASIPASTPHAEGRGFDRDSPFAFVPKGVVECLFVYAHGGASGVNL